jgi:hypothetical protein
MYSSGNSAVLFSRFWVSESATSIWPTTPKRQGVAQGVAKRL